MADNKKGSEAYKVLPGWPFQILGVLCLVIGYFCLYPIHFSRPSWLHWPDWKFELPDPPKFTAPQSPSSGTAEASPSTNPELERVKRLPRSKEDPYFFEKERRVFEIKLEPGEWSRKIVTLANTDTYRIDVEPQNTPFFVEFNDGYIAQVGGIHDRMPDVGLRRGVFRILGTQLGQTATVTITVHK